MAASLTGTDVVCVGFADWDTELWTNQHHLMSRLASDNQVLFVESLGLRRPELAGRDVRRILRRVSRGLRGVRTVDGVHVLAPLVLPLHSKQWQVSLNRWLLRRQVGRARRRLGMSRTLLWGYVPQAVDLVDAVDAERVLYHCVDDIAAQKGVDGGAFRALERRLVERADLVLASAANLYERLSAESDRVHFAPNVADTAHFARALEAGPVDARVDALPSPRIVFVGALVATKLDLELIVGVARARREWSVVLVGPVGVGDPSTDVTALHQEPNVHMVGARRLGDLPAVLRGADVAWIPYALNDLTRSVFPMKVYEYLSAGLQVVSTRLPALVGVEEVRFAEDVDDSVRAVDEALAQDTIEHRRRRSERASLHSWDERIHQIAQWLRGAGSMCER